MKNLTNLLIVLAAVLSINSAFADTVKIKAPAINGKLIANNLELTDWQAVLSCHFNYQGTRSEAVRYPQTLLNKSEGSTYSLKIKNITLNEFIPRGDLLTCAYKLILIGKNVLTHQVAFGEIYLIGKETGMMSESELQVMKDANQLAKILAERTKELTITYGKDGGIVEEL